MLIKGKKVTLRAIEESDLELIHRWSNDPEINYMLGGWHFPSSLKDQLAWFNGLSLGGINQRFAIDTPDLGLIGIANLVEINWKDRNAFHGMLLGDKDMRGKGYGMDTIMAINRYAFDELGLVRLNGSMIEYNEASLKVYLQKCGWKQEGIKKKHYYRKNRWWNQVVVGITDIDYRELMHNSKYWESDSL